MLLLFCDFCLLIYAAAAADVKEASLYNNYYGLLVT